MKKYLLIAILVLSTVLRFYQLDQIPASLNPDEKFNGYLAYSLLNTGQDERGKVFPIALRTFGSWTLIGYPLLEIIPVAMFGLTELSARLPAAVLYIFGTFLIYLISKKLFHRESAALLSALFFSLSPWGLYLSRISHETVMGCVLFLTGLVIFLKALEKKFDSKLLLVSALIFGLSMVTHYAYIIFVPPMVGLLFFFNFSLFKKKAILASIGIFGAFVTIVVMTILTGSIHEMTDVGIFNNPHIIYGRVDKFRGDGNHPSGDVLEKFHNRYLGVGYQLAQNYAAVFSPSFMFDKGGEGLFHNLGYFGNLYLFDFFLILAGLIFMAWKREKWLFFLALWVAVTPLTSIFTKDNPSSTRLFPLVPVFALLSGYGLSAAARLRKKFRYLIAVVITGVIFLDVLWFFDAYFVHLNVQRARFLNYGYKQAVEIANRYPNAKVVMIGPENFAYISFLFYNKFDPQHFRNEVTYYPLKSNGFQFVKSFDRYEFVEHIDRGKMDDTTLYIDYATPNDSTNLIRLPGGDQLFTFFPPKEN